MGRGSKVIQMGYLTPRGFRGSAPNGKNQQIFKKSSSRSRSARANSYCVDTFVGKELKLFMEVPWVTPFGP